MNKVTIDRELLEECNTLRQQRDKLLERQPDSFKHGYAFAREANQAQHGIRLQRECDTLLQQLAERDAEILEQCRLNGMGAERELKQLTQRDKLAGLLRRVLATHDYHTYDGEQAADEAHAALAEVDKKS